MESIYLDHAAATPIRPEVREAMDALDDRLTGNPSSLHAWGRRARRTLEEARERVAHSLDTSPSTIRFVRGGTESVNLAILGRAAWARSSSLPRPRFLYSTVEHSAVRESMCAAARGGVHVDGVPVSPDGEISLPDAGELQNTGTQLVSVQWVNQETGLILPVERLAEVCREAGVPIHVDGVQAVGKIPMSLRRTPVSLLSVSGHKLGGPRGVGILTLAEPSLIQPMLFGGGQEDGLRPGTEDVAGAVGLAVALERSVEGLGSETSRLRRLRDRLEERLRSRVEGLRVHAADGPRAPHISNLGFSGIPLDVLPSALDVEGIGVSAGSACRSGSATVSRVLGALYGEEAGDFAPIRISLGWPTTEQDVERAAEIIPIVVERARSG